MKIRLVTDDYYLSNVATESYSSQTPQFTNCPIQTTSTIEQDKTHFMHISIISWFSSAFYLSVGQIHPRTHSHSHAHEHTHVVVII